MVNSSEEETDLCPADLEELVSLLRCPLDKLQLMLEASQLLEQAQFLLIIFWGSFYLPCLHGTFAHLTSFARSLLKSNLL